jgi:hypothetical protein
MAMGETGKSNRGTVDVRRYRSKPLNERVIGSRAEKGAVTVVSRWMFDLAFASSPQSGLAWFRFLFTGQREPQKIDRLRAFSAMLACMSMRKATEFNELGLGRFRGQAEPLQPLAQRRLDTKSVRAILEAHHKVVDVSHQIGLAS